MNTNSGLRVFWIIWCCFWAAFWMFSGFVTLIGFFGVPLSLLAILIPIGVQQAPPRHMIYQLPPPCVRCGAPYYAHWQGQCPPRQQLQPVLPIHTAPGGDPR